MSNYSFRVTVRRKDGSTTCRHAKVSHPDAIDEVSARRAVIAKYMSGGDCVKSIERYHVGRKGETA